MLLGEPQADPRVEPVERFHFTLLMTRLPKIANPLCKPYPSDLSDGEWAILKPLLPKPKDFGHPVDVDFREILNGIFYVRCT